MIVEKDLCLFFVLMFAVIVALYQNRKLKEELRWQKEHFISILGHDFKVTLLAQLRALDILQNSVHPDTAGYFILRELNNSCRQNLDMVNMLSDVYKAEAGDNIFRNEYFDIEGVFGLIKEEFADELNTKELEPVFKIQDKIICADKKYLTKVLKLILRTAADYSERNSIINIHVFKQKSCLNCEISYFGKRLSEEEISGMLSGRSEYSAVGHGISMDFCRRITELQGGHIHFSVNNHNINTFRFSLPAVNTECSKTRMQDIRLVSDAAV